MTDLNRAIDFYVGKLGFELGFTGRGQSSVLLMFRTEPCAGCSGFSLSKLSCTAIPPSITFPFGVTEADVDRMVPYLRERGIEPIHPPAAPVQGAMNEPIVHGWMPAASVFFHDPDGHLLELIADLSDAPRPEILYRPLSEWRALVGRVAR